jgi:putative ABC transport system permease protein
VNLASLAWRYLWSRPLPALLNLLLLTLGLASSSFVLLAGAQVERAFERDLAGIDAVVGAKGSPMQLILAGVFHIDIAPGNIALADVLALRQHPQVAQVIPLSMGDAYQGFRIVGSTPDYLAHYAATLAKGTAWTGPMQVVLGAQAAAGTRLQIGARFSGSHGLVQAGKEHADQPYRVVGMLAPCACVLDRLILTATESVWQVHEPQHGAAPQGQGQTQADQHDQEAKREVTVALVRYHTPLAAVSFPRHVNSSTAMQAAVPAVEVTRLLRMTGVGLSVLKGFAAVLLLTAALSVFIALWNAVRERQGDLALLRLLGAPPRRVAGLVLCEALWLALLACVLGLGAGHGLASLAGCLLDAQRSVSISGWTWAPGEVFIPLLALLLALLAACLPARAAYRVDVSQLLAAT